MTLQAATATPGLWLDTDVPITKAVLAAAKLLGVKGFFRYGPLPRNDASRDLSAGELADITGEGYGCTIVQHVRAGLWMPAEHSSSEDAVTIAEWADKISMPKGAHLGLDLESIGGSAGETRIYAIGWQRALIEAGYRAMLYHGFAVPMTEDDLYALPGFDCYWTDAGNRPVAKRGNAIAQGREIVVAGIEFDRDEVAPDKLGGLPYVAMAA